MESTGPSILVVDDDEAIFAAIRRTLRGTGYRLTYAENGEQGLSALERERFEIVISDNRAHGMTGAEFLELVRLRHPGIVRIMLSSDAGSRGLQTSLQRDAVFRLLPKPWNVADFKKTIRFALQYWRELAVEARLFDAVVARGSVSQASPASRHETTVRLESVTGRSRRV